MATGVLILPLILPDNGAESRANYREIKMFNLVQKEIQHRQSINEETVGTGRYSSKYPFSGLLECGICGHKMRRQVRIMGNKKKVPAWCCTYRVTNGRSVCDSHQVREDVLEATYIAAMRTIMDTASDVTDAIRSTADVVMEAENNARLEAIEKEILGIQSEALELHKAKQRLEVGAAEYEARIKELQEIMKTKEKERAALESSTLKYEEVIAWLKAFDEGINSGKLLTATDCEIMRMIVDRIIVKDNGIEVCLKCGVSIGQEFVR